VAAKTLKVTSPTIPHGKRLMEEAKLLAHIGAHENIVKFLGVYKKPSPKGEHELMSRMGHFSNQPSCFN
jgi:serine/threonine protein kinase